MNSEPLHSVSGGQGNTSSGLGDSILGGLSNSLSGSWQTSP